MIAGIDPKIRQRICAAFVARFVGGLVRYFRVLPVISSFFGYIALSISLHPFDYQPSYNVNRTLLCLGSRLLIIFLLLSICRCVALLRVS